MKRTLLTLSLTFLLALTLPAAAQPAREKIQDRHPAYAADPLPGERTVRVEIIHTFEQRGEPVEELLRRQAGGGPVRIENVSASSVTLERPGRPPDTVSASAEAKPERVRVASIRRPDQATCLRHGLRTVWSGKQWRCRR